MSHDSANSKLFDSLTRPNRTPVDGNAAIYRIGFSAKIPAEMVDLEDLECASCGLHDIEDARVVYEEVNTLATDGDAQQAIDKVRTSVTDPKGYMPMTDFRLHSVQCLAEADLV